MEGLACEGVGGQGAGVDRLAGEGDQVAEGVGTGWNPDPVQLLLAGQHYLGWVLTELENRDTTNLHEFVDQAQGGLAGASG